MMSGFVEQHLATIRSGVASTTMLAQVPVDEQLIVAKMTGDVIKALDSRTFVD